MTNLSYILGLVGVGLVGATLLNKESIKIYYLKKKGIFQANKIAIDFFREEIKKNPKILLNEAILKFEDIDNKFTTLEDFSLGKGRDIYSYENAYRKLFNIAKKIS